jgi:hypothetical protein
VDERTGLLSTIESWLNGGPATLATSPQHSGSHGYGGHGGYGAGGVNGFDPGIETQR